MSIPQAATWVGDGRLAGGQTVCDCERSTWVHYIRLTKPRIMLMVVLVAAVGFVMGKARAAGEGGFESWSDWLSFIAVMGGTALSCMGAAVLNQVYERDVDALMSRTKARPLPAGRISYGQALGYGLMLAVGGIAVLAVSANPLTAGLSAFTVVSYTLIYTPFKRLNSMSTMIGAVPGAVPPVMGYVAATGRVDIVAWLLFAILYVWQLPHVLAIAWLYRKQYAKAGILVLPVEDRLGRSTFRQILVGCLILLPLGLMPTMLNICGVIYFTVALVMGIGFLGAAVALAFRRTRRRARMLFYVSLVYLPIVYGFMMLDQV